MKRRQSIYEAQMAEVLPRGLAAPIKGARIAIFGFSDKTDRYMQIEEAIDRRYHWHSPAIVTLMQRPEYKRIKKSAKQRMLEIDNEYGTGAVILPLDAQYSSLYGDEAKNLV